MKVFLFFLSMFFCCNAFAQNTISGVVIDNNKQPIAGANIKLLEDKISGVSSTDGKFTLKTEKDFPLTIVVSSIGFKSKDEFNTSIERNTFFNVNYVHDLNFARVPKRIVPYIGAGINLGNGAGVCGITGFYVPVFDRFKFDFRYEIGNKVNQLQFGLIFKYQKEYLWNKNK